MTKYILHFHGPLAAKVGENNPIVFFAGSIADAIKGVTSQLPGFQPRIDNPRSHVRVDGYESVDDLLALRPDTSELELHLYPDISGGKQGGFFQLLIGAVFIAASFIPGLQGVTVLGMSLAGTLLSTGISFALGGLLQIMSPAPKNDTTGAGVNPDPSRYLGTPGNTTKVGTRRPIGVGRFRVPGQILSFDIVAHDVASANTTNLITAAPSGWTNLGA